MSAKSPPNSPNKRLLVENELDQLKEFMAKQPKNFETLVDWKYEAENWIGKMDEWLSDSQVMSSAYLKTKLMSVYGKLNDQFEKAEEKEEAWQTQVNLMYHHQLPKRGVHLTNDEYQRLLFSDFNNPQYHKDEQEESKK